MRLQDRIFEFTSLGDEKLNVGNLLDSKLVVNGNETNSTLGSLFKGSVKVKSSSRLKGFSILESVNEKNEIEIDGKVYNINFLAKEGTQEEPKLISFKLKGYINAQIMRNDKVLSPDEIANFGKLIIGNTTQEKPKDAAPKESASTKAETKVEAEVEEVVKEEIKEEPKIKLFSPDNYNEDKIELLNEGWSEYNPEKPSNQRILTRSEDTILIELLEDDYSVIKGKDLDKYDIELDESTKLFKIEKSKQLA